MGPARVTEIARLDLFEIAKLAETSRLRSQAATAALLKQNPRPGIDTMWTKEIDVVRGSAP
jgi:hypothetical protein